MNPLLVSGFGTSITVNKRRLVVVNKNQDIHFEFYPHRIDHDSIVIDGHSGFVTFEAMRWLLKHNIKLVLLNWNGNLLGTTLPEEPKSGKLRLKQHEKCLDPEFRFEIAYKITQTKIKNVMTVIQYLGTQYDFVNHNEIVRIEEKERKFLLHDIEKKQDSKFKRLMNYEGKIAIYYFECLTRLFQHLYPKFNFDGRKNKTSFRNTNAADEINALLNYGYSILESEVRKCINTVGLDPAIGFLHESTVSKSPLVYDIQELFRWLMDISIIELLEGKKLKKNDFFVTENFNIRLEESAAKLLIEKIKNNFNKKVSYKRNRNHTYQNILLDNVQVLANFISGKNKKLEFLIPNITIENNFDFKKIKLDLIQMTPKRRKELGINKSTLWYLKKGLESGKKPKIYKKVLEKLDTSLA